MNYSKLNKTFKMNHVIVQFLSYCFYKAALMIGAMHSAIFLNLGSTFALTIFLIGSMLLTLNTFNILVFNYCTNDLMLYESWYGVSCKCVHVLLILYISYLIESIILAMFRLTLFIWYHLIPNNYDDTMDPRKNWNESFIEYFQS